MDVPAFELLDEVEADVAATKAQWGRYADFLRERDEMANRDWLSMRDQVRPAPLHCAALGQEMDAGDGAGGRRCARVCLGGGASLVEPRASFALAR